MPEESETTKDLEKRQAAHCARHGQPWLGPQTETTPAGEAIGLLKAALYNKLTDGKISEKQFDADIEILEGIWDRLQ